MKLKELQSLLQDIEPFRDPKVELEQYPTGAHIAAQMIFNAEQSFGDIDDKVVMDLGCGAGMLTIAAAVMGAGHVLAVDIDQEAIDVAVENVEGFEDLNTISFLLSNVEDLPEGLKAHTVITNPPFGTRKEGADMLFLRQALRCASGAVYSLHKSSTRAHITKVAPGMGASSARVLAQLRYELPASYKFHKKKEKDIEVDLWRFEPMGTGGE